MVGKFNDMCKTKNLTKKKNFSKYGLLVYFNNGSKKYLKYEDDDERDEDLRRLEFDPDVNLVCLFPMDEEND